MLIFVLLLYLNGLLDLNALSLICLCEKDGWKTRWVESDWKRSEGKAGSFKHTAGKWSGDPDDKGLCFFSSRCIKLIETLSQCRKCLIHV